MGFQSQLPDLISDFGAALQQRKKYPNSKIESAKQKILAEIDALFKKDSLQGQGYTENQINLVAARLIRRRPFEVEESPTLSSESKAGKSKHPNPIKGTVGEPDLDVNDKILAEGGFKYKKHGYDRAAQGHEELVKSTLKHLNSRNPFGFKFTLTPANIIFSPAKALVSFAIRAAMTTKENKKVLVADPAWVSYVPMIETFYGDPVILPLDEDTFLPDKEFFSVLEENTDACALIINSPSNPVGNVFPPKILEKIAKTYDNPYGTIISDEVYHTLVYDGEHTSMAVFDPIRTVVIDSFSKSHAAPGLRGGYAVSGDTSFVGHMKKINSQNSGGMAVVVQKALTVAFDEGVLKDIKDKDYPEFEARRDVICYGLLFLNTLGTNSNYRAKLIRPSGAFYAFVKFYHKDPTSGEEVPFTKENIDALQDELTSDKYGVYTVEGYHFGDRGKSCLRISYGSLNQGQLVDLVVRLANCFIERSGGKGTVTEEEVRKFIAGCSNGQHMDIQDKYLIAPQ